MENKQQIISDYFRSIGAKGKKNRWANATPEERRKQGVVMNKARLDKSGQIS